MKSVKALIRSSCLLICMIVLLSFGQSCKTHVVSTYQSVKSKENSIYIDVLRDIEERGYIRIGTTGDFIPFSYHVGDNKTEYSGIDIQLGKDLASSLGVEAKFVKTSWPTLLDDLANGLYDISMSGVTIKLERQREGLFSIPYLSSGKAAIARDEDVEKYNSINAINQPGVRVILNPGGTNES
ncbi:MAG: transporter substrate-binding domain-containing protein, partial [Saprospiraceae bacterium]|nr:transporter substrate-binding domain-containing protein [Saprospiraceae bacterium]